MKNAPHLVVFFAALLLVQAVRLGGLGTQAVAPLFIPYRGYVDFDHAYYPAGEAIRNDPSQLYRGAEYDPPTGGLRVTSVAQFVNIPLVAWLFVPFTVMPLPYAGTVLLIINIGVALACLHLVQRRIGNVRPLWRWAITLAFVTSGPLMNALNLGQTTPLVLLLLLLGEASLHRGHEARAGLWLGLAGLIKIPPLLLLPYFVLRRRGRVVVAASATLLLAVAVSVLCYGWGLHATYFRTTIRGHAGTALAAHNCQSLDALLARLFTDAPLQSWQPMALPAELLMLRWVLLAAWLAVCAWALRAPAAVSYPRMLLEAGIVMCTSLVALPISWSHYGAWLLPVAVAAGAAITAMQRESVPLWPGVLLALAVLLINFPEPPPPTLQRLSDQLWFRVAVSHQFFGTSLLFAVCVWCVRQAPRRS